MGKRTARALPWLPVALLLAAAAGHVALARCCALSPWLGGGFGMFATVDARAVRVLREADGAELALPPALEDDADRAAMLPTDARLRALAGRPELAGGALRLEAWETRFGPGLAREPRLLRALSVDAGDARP
jgi:hypothetical protein